MICCSLSRGVVRSRDKLNTLYPTCPGLGEHDGDLPLETPTLKATLPHVGHETK